MITNDECVLNKENIDQSVWLEKSENVIINSFQLNENTFEQMVN